MTFHCDGRRGHLNHQAATPPIQMLVIMTKGWRGWKAVPVAEVKPLTKAKNIGNCGRCGRRNDNTIFLICLNRCFDIFWVKWPFLSLWVRLVPRILFYFSGFSLCPGSCLRTGFVPDPKIGGCGGSHEVPGRRKKRPHYFMTSWGQLSPRIPLSTCLSGRPSRTLSFNNDHNERGPNSSFWPIHSLKFFRSTLPSGRSLDSPFRLCNGRNGD